MTVAAILLAAGASRRMGQPKPLLDWGGQPLIAWEVDQLLQSGVDEFVVVLGAHAEEVRRHLGDAARYCVFNQRWPQGRATSVVAGATALSRGGRPIPEAIVVQNVDQPTRADIIDHLVAEQRAAGAEIVEPTYDGQRGHPLVFAGTLLPELRTVRDETLGIRAVRERHPPRLVPMDEPVVCLNLNTPDRLEEGRRLLGVA